MIISIMESKWRYYCWLPHEVYRTTPTICHVMTNILNLHIISITYMSFLIAHFEWLLVTMYSANARIVTPKRFAIWCAPWGMCVNPFRGSHKSCSLPVQCTHREGPSMLVLLLIIWCHNCHHNDVNKMTHFLHDGLDDVDWARESGGLLQSS